jgi:hypothetical protein
MSSYLRVQKGTEHAVEDAELACRHSTFELEEQRMQILLLRGRKLASPNLSHSVDEFMMPRVKAMLLVLQEFCNLDPSGQSGGATSGGPGAV